MIRVGITGQGGFVGQHLYNTLKLYPQDFECIEFKRDFFNCKSVLNDFVSKCNVIVHLAALNRNSDPEVIYSTNVDLVNKLIISLEETRSTAHVIFSSSSQEQGESPYGRSKYQGRNLFKEWSTKFGGKFTGLIIPNVFGPFGRPGYNSFIATFSHKLINNESPIIEIDSLVNLIYIDDLIKRIEDEIRFGEGGYAKIVAHTDEIKVSQVLGTLDRYRSQYLHCGIIPKFANRFELNLFNTFRSFIDIRRYFPKLYTQHIDSRGSFVEVMRLNSGGQVSFSTTVPGITRGNHFHTRKIERFAVIKGNALVQLRKINSDDVIAIELSGEYPSFVDMPIWYTHNITNIGEHELMTLFWINEFYDPTDPDTFMETV